MADQRQQLTAVLVLAGLAGALLFVSMQQGRVPGGGPGPPPPGPGAPHPPEGELPPLTPEQIIAAHNGPRPTARAVPFYKNEETWELNRDAKGRLTSITVHREATVTRP